MSWTRCGGRGTDCGWQRRDVFNEKPMLEEAAPANGAAAGVEADVLPRGAVIHTTKGDITLKLFPDDCPKTVENFTTHARNGYYDGILFHRVIKDFMIQGGDPLGNGTGGPGYQFKNEVDPSLHFDRKGVMAMANAGPDTNGSQFFITVAPATWLDGSYSIFGQVVSGQDVADKISQVPTGKNDRPLTPVTILHVKIIRVAP